MAFSSVNRPNTITRIRNYNKLHRSQSLSELPQKGPTAAKAESRYGYSPRIYSRKNSPPDSPDTEDDEQQDDEDDDIYDTIDNDDEEAPVSKRNRNVNSVLPSPPNNTYSPPKAKYGIYQQNVSSRPTFQSQFDDKKKNTNHSGYPDRRGEKPQILESRYKINSPPNYKPSNLKNIASPRPKVNDHREETRNKNPNLMQQRGVNRPTNNAPFDNNKLRYSRHNTPPTPIDSPKRNAASLKKQKGIEPPKKPMRSLSLSNLPNATPPSAYRSRSRASQYGDHYGTPESSREASETKDISLKKVYKDGKWREHREETTFFKKPDGSISKKSKLRESKLDDDYDDESKAMKSLSKLDSHSDEHSLEQERSSQLYSSHGRGLIQDDQEEFGKEILAKMNSYRVEHMVKSLKINESLSQKAREWAKYLAYSGRVGLANRHDLGESIFVKVLPRPYAKVSGDAIVEKWYSESKEHHYGNHSNISAANFTQMIWRATKEIGTAIERSVDGKIAYVVVFYYPKGNFPGEHTKQVPPIGGFSSKERNEKGLIQPHVAEQDEEFIDGVMRATNYYRLCHDATPLNLDKTLTEHAQQWADQLASEDRVRSRPRNSYGENIYRSTLNTASQIPGQEPVEYWYKKKAFHNFTEPGDIRSAAFTQLVWKATRDIGIGIAKSKTNNVYVVANFNPPGNRVGQFVKQVAPVKWK